jgi:nucleoside-diphosphate-sugar epimerase
MATAFVTGGSGFVGRNLLRHLRARDTAVRALARSDEAAETVSALGAEPIRGALADEAAMGAGMQECDVVYHAAARVGAGIRREPFYKANVEGTGNALSAALAAGVPRFVHVSTEAVLANGRPIVKADESVPRAKHPAGLYPLTKGLAEERVLAANSPELETVIVRPRFIWGNDDTVLLPRFARAAESGRFMWFGDGRQLTSTCHVDNACQGLILAAERGRAGQIYFVTDGEPVEFRSFITAMLRTQGVEPGDRRMPRRLAWWLATAGEWTWRLFNFEGAPLLTRSAVALIGVEVTVSDAKARRELEYEPLISREEGLRAMEEDRSEDSDEEE